MEPPPTRLSPPPKEENTFCDLIHCCLNLNNPTSETTHQSYKQPPPSNLNKVTDSIYEEVKAANNTNYEYATQNNPLNHHPHNHIHHQNQLLTINTDPASIHYQQLYNAKQLSRRMAAERMCPFIYDELPAFILENKNYLIFDSPLPPPAPPPPPPQLPPPIPLLPPPSMPHIIGGKTTLSPQLPLSKPPKLNKSVLTNATNNNNNNNNNLIIAKSSLYSNSSPMLVNKTMNNSCATAAYDNSLHCNQELKMFSLIIERETRRTKKKKTAKVKNANLMVTSASSGRIRRSNFSNNTSSVATRAKIIPIITPTPPNMLAKQEECFL